MKLKAISVMIIAGAAVLAAAQMGDNKPIGLDARVGAFFPIDSGTQGVGNTWLDLGLDFEAKKLSPSASLKVSLDYAYRGGFTSLPLLLNYQIRQGPIYAFVGAGGNFNRIPQDDGTVFSKTNWAYDAGIGYDVMKNGGSPIFVEGRFFGNENSNLNGFAVFLGIRM
jgi:hypothetical protein